MNKIELLKEASKKKKLKVGSGGNKIIDVNQKIRMADIEEELDAKIDTGNDGYNVLHAENIQWNGDVVNFTSHGTEFEMTAVEKVEVVTADGSSDRPVVLFDIEFLGKEYTDVPFSLSDRSEMDEPVLLGEPFLKELRLIINLSKGK